MKRKNKLVWNYVNDSMIIINNETGELHKINNIGGYIWEIIDDCDSENQICKMVTQKFSNCDNDSVKRDVSEFVSILYEKGLLI